MKKQIKNFIFDLDGTLLNSLEDIGNACNFALKKNGFPQHDIMAYRRMVGNGFDKLVQRALPKDLALETDQLAVITAEAKTYYFSNLYNKTVPYTGITKMLGELTRKKRNLAVLSNKPDNMTKEIIAHFFPDIPFVKVQGALPDIPLKPSPASLLNLIDTHFWDPADCCYIGDSDVDVRTGKNAGINTAAVSWGFRDKKELEKEAPDFLCDSPDEIVML